MPDQSTTTDVARMTVILRHDGGTVAITVPVILPTSAHDARERAITMVCAAEGAPRRAVLSVAREGEPAAPMGAWVIGHNMPGYLPESDTYAFASHRDAWAALVDDMRRWADEDDESYASVPCDCTDEDEHDDCHGTTRATVDAIVTDDAPRDGRDWHGIVNDNDGHGLSWWLQWSPDAVADED